MELEVKLQAFEGPLDLLLHLIDKNKVSIYDIPISDITEQYMGYVRDMKEEELERTSEFLVMAATLLDIKARMLLPAEKDEAGEEEDPRAELVNRLLEYRKYKELGEGLADMSVGSDMRYYREEVLPAEVLEYRAPVDLDALLDGLTSRRLTDIFKDVLRRIDDSRDTTRPDISRLQKEVVPLASRIDYVRTSVRQGRKLSFRKLMKTGVTKVEVIVTFLAILEMLKSGEIHLTEDSTIDDFTIEENIHGATTGED